MLLTENYLAFDPSQSNNNLYNVGTHSFNFRDSSGSRIYSGNTIQTYLDLYDEDWFDGNELNRLWEYAEAGKRIPVVVRTINKIEVDPNLDPQPSVEQIAEWENGEGVLLDVFYLDSYSSDTDGISCSNSTANTTFFISSDGNVNFTCGDINFPFVSPSPISPIPPKE